jgi:maltodextrin utilization protein YvdJ
VRDFYYSEICAIAHDNVDSFEVNSVIDSLKKFVTERVVKALKQYNEDVLDFMKLTLSKLDDQSNVSKSR